MSDFPPLKDFEHSLRIRHKIDGVLVAVLCAFLILEILGIFPNDTPIGWTHVLLFGIVVDSLSISRTIMALKCVERLQDDGREKGKGPF